MATHSSILAWGIPGTEEPSGLPSMGSHRVGHNWSDLAAAAIWLPGEGWEEGIVKEFGMDMYELLYVKWITNKDLLYSTWNSVQCYVAAWMGEVLGENGYMYMFDWGSWHCTGDRDQDHPHGKEMQKSKMAVWGDLTNSCKKKRSKKQRRKGKI